ncbi:MAG: type II toxin-antitoxin system VapC family toxin [Candidatus Eremiobacteraeota bacterium]|uniref:PIN domain-containing protein n=1 Tax=mine drainage metagenome TaxID=410659 RepID=E6Q6W2_9ZZZZ|nr:type II toxin-antitoxin system VapC family toxin [Candidatus Eremiobacteraeota bacterium]
MIVVDASMALRWVLADEIGEEAAAARTYVSERGGCVPGNFQSESAHGLLQAERRKRISASDASAAFTDIMELTLTVELPNPHVIVSSAREYGLTCYDAAYLALALQSGFSIATADEHLRKAARAENVLWNYSGSERRA